MSEEIQEAQGGYNEKAVAPFLAKFNPNAKKKLHGMSATSAQLEGEDKHYFYHVTTLKNLASILRSGLDPNQGGIGGAGTLIAGERDYEDGQAPSQPRQGTHFNQRSHGYVHASERPDVLTRYIYEYDALADKGTEEMYGFQSAPVMLRFKKNILQQEGRDLYEKDPCEGRKTAEVRAIRTTQPIGWDQLEILTEGGWTPLNQPFENDRLMRDEIYDNVSAILSAGKSTTMTGARLGEPEQGPELKQGPEPELESESEAEMDTVQAPASKRPPELLSVSDLMLEEGMGQAGTTKKPGGAENSKGKSMKK